MKVTAYVDGSFNAVDKSYGAGIVLIFDNGEVRSCSNSGNHPAFIKSRNVAGEVLAAVTAIAICNKMENIEKLTIHYDYSGIECWATGVWRANAPISKVYQDAVKSAKYPLEFKKVKAHSGNEWNELADRLAKEACGLS